MNTKTEILIVGAGLAGLCCALRLQQEGIPFTIFEASDSVGGRVKTDIVDGFLLDRGFQILLSAYPEAKAVLNYQALNLKPFLPGAMVRYGGKFHELSDPWRCPAKALDTFFSPIGTVADKVRMGLLRQRLLASPGWPSGSDFNPPTTLEVLKHLGFSDAMIAQFFKPFLGGIFLESELATSSTLFDFVFKMLSDGENVLPAGGMQSIPQQIADKLPANSIKFNQRVTQVGGTNIILSSGEKVAGSAIVIATEEPQARKLLGQPRRGIHRSQTCIYFSADRAPLSQPILILNGEPNGIVNNFCVPSNISSSYAPRGKSLLSASIVGDIDVSSSELHRLVIEQLTQWFGDGVRSWEHLRTYHINYALPDQTPQAVAAQNRSYKGDFPIYACGDYKETGSINGAMVSGRKVAEALTMDLAQRFPAQIS